MNTKHLKWLIFTLALCAAPWFLKDQGYIMRVLILVLLFAAMGQSWNIVGGLANQISLGHAAFFGIGCYTSTILLVRFGLSPWIGLILGMLLAVIASAILCLPTMRLRGHYFALATLAFGEVMRAIANTWSSLTGGPVGISVPLADDSFWLMQFRSSIPYYYIMLGMLIITTLIFMRISNSKLGYRLRAVKENQDAAEVIGVHTTQTKVTAALISAALMAACGTLFAQFNFFFDPDSAFSLVQISVKVALICIVGGLGVAAGPIIGAFFILPVEEILNSMLAGQAAGISQLAYGLILIGIILVEPNGLLRLPQRIQRYWHSRTGRTLAAANSNSPM